MKNLWFLFPVATFWAIYPVIYTMIDPHPFAEWWGFPLLLTCSVVWIMSAGYAAKKYNQPS